MDKLLALLAELIVKSDQELLSLAFEGREEGLFGLAESSTADRFIAEAQSAPSDVFETRQRVPTFSHFLLEAYESLGYDSANPRRGDVADFVVVTGLLEPESTGSDNAIDNIVAQTLRDFENGRSTRGDIRSSASHIIGRKWLTWILHGGGLANRGQQGDRSFIENVAELKGPDLSRVVDAVFDHLETSAELREEFAPRLAALASESKDDEYIRTLKILEDLGVKQFIARMKKENNLPKSVRRDALKRQLNKLAGNRLDIPLKEKQTIASELQDLADEFGCLFLCDKSSSLGRLVAVKNNDIDYFRLKAGNRILGSYPEFPSLKLVPKPAPEF